MVESIFSIWSLSFRGKRGLLKIEKRTTIRVKETCMVESIFSIWSLSFASSGHVLPVV
jgi:hypothetical protein